MGMTMQGERRLKPDIHLTKPALERMRQQTHEAGKPAIRLALREAGCSGLEYVMDFAEHPGEGDLTLELGDFSLFVDVRSYDRALAGLTIDFQRDAMSSGFVFINPNKKGECGCGVSFSV
jgi:iron-sulfur cluster assembly protein